MADRTAARYEELIRRAREVSLLSSSTSLLGWDQRTYMPPKGAGHRAEQLALLARLAHERATDPVIGDLLGQVEGSALVADPTSETAVNVRELRRDYDRAVKVPAALVEELARTTTLAEEAWVEARRHSDFSAFRPWLEKVVVLKRQEAEALGYVESPYNALLDGYEPGATALALRGLFAPLRDALVSLLGRIRGSRRRPDATVLARDYPVSTQARFGRRVAAAMGFDFTAGRLDVTTHPFCSGIGPGDTRITTRYDRHAFGEAFFGILHEAGHGLYDQGLDPKHYGAPMGEAVSLGIHESQSRLWENFVGRGRPFWEYCFPQARRAFPRVLGDVRLDDFVFAINEVRPSYIRVEADEVTYNLHILLRFDLEEAMLLGDLAVADLPGVWNERFRKDFDLTPPDHAHGCLQDVHWSSGAIGYFPTYTLGNLDAAQFFGRARREIADLDRTMARGEFRPLLEWLRDKIHRQGRRYGPADLIQVVTDGPLSHRPFVEYLTGKFEALYGI